VISNTLKSFLHILHRRLNTFRIFSEHAERTFLLATIPGDFKGTEFRKNGKLYSYRYCDKIFTKKGVYESLEVMEHACLKMQKMQAE
jgi:hypothetical protein